MALQDALIRLESIGLTDVLLPFALIFTIVYAVSKVVPHIEGDKRLRIVMATIISLIVVIPHVTNSYPPGMDVVEIINSSIPQVAMIIVGVFLALILIATSAGRKDTFDDYTKYIRWIALVLVGLIFLDNINFGYGTGFFGSFPFLGWFSDPDFQALLLIVIVFGLIVYFVTGSKGPTTPDEYRKVADELQKKSEAAAAAAKTN